MKKKILFASVLKLVVVATVISSMLSFTFLGFVQEAHAQASGLSDIGYDEEVFTIGQLGEKVMEQMGEELFAPELIDSGIKLNSRVQFLEAVVDELGIKIVSSVEKTQSGDDVEVIPRSFYRQGGDKQEINSSGRLEYNEHSVSLDRGIVQEQFFNSVDGIRQDFIIKEKVKGDGDYVYLRLDITGAEYKVDTDQQVSLKMHDSGRTLVYNNLYVTDFNNNELDSKFVVDEQGIMIQVNDVNAIYPIRIDPTFTNDDWVGIGGIPIGTNGTVRAVALDSLGNLYVGGHFTIAGGVTVNRIAMWDGSSWSSLGKGLPSGNVYAIAIDSDDNVYIGGTFSIVTNLDDSTVSASRVAKWDGTSWSALGSGLNNTVWALEFDSNEELYVGGQFTSAGGVSNTSRIAKWDGTNWSAIGRGVNGTVYDVAIDSNDHVFVGGMFTTATNSDGLSVPTNRVAKWNGSNWSAFEDGANGTVWALFVDPSDNLYIGGEFTSVDGVTHTSRVAKWDGTVWSAIGSGVDNNIVNSIAMDSSGDLYVGGTFTLIGGSTFNRIAKWDGTSWSNLGTGATGTVNVIYVDGDELYGGGNFQSLDGMRVSNIGKWDGTSWRQFGNGVDEALWCLAVDSAENVYIGGQFIYVDNQIFNRIAKWDGTSWSNLGTGANNIVYTIYIDNDDILYIGGMFTEVDGVTANRVAKWDGTSWSSLGDGINNGFGNGIVWSLAKDSNGVLYAGGTFTQASGATANSIAKWDGTSWSQVGGGANANAAVMDIIFDSSDNMYIAGGFTTIGGLSINRVAMWDGTSWSGFGDGLGGTVWKLIFDQSGNLYAGGGFTSSGATTVNRIAMWDGTSWSQVGDGVNNTVHNMVFDNSENLYVGGVFSQAGGVSGYARCS